MKLSVGPVLYYWEKAQLLDFYREIAASAADVVYLGEAVCSRRHSLRLDDWLEVAQGLADAGKEVVLSTQALLESESDLKTLRRIADNGRFTVEANDLGALGMLAGKVPFVGGPHLNTYNPQTLALLAELGARRWVIPVEMSRDALGQMLQHCPDAMETEVFAYGRLPLAFSARCFTARHHNLPKDDCRFRCLEYPDGLGLKTREGRPFLVLNGIQTQSASVYNLVHELGAMDRLGVSVVRVSPQARHTGEVLQMFRDCLEQRIDPGEAAARMASLMPGEPCDGFWHGKPGLERHRWTTAS